MTISSSPVTSWTQSCQLDGKGPRNNKVEQPLRRGRESDIQGSQTSRRDLGDENPAGGTPAELEEGGEDKDEGESEVAGDGDGLVELGRGDADVDADVEHAEGLADGRDEEGAAAAERVGHEEQEDAARHDLDDAIDARAEQRRRGALNAQVHEDGWRVDVNGVGARELLEDHQGDT
jgi:hypothetical protein